MPTRENLGARAVLFDVQAALAEILRDAPATTATTATKPRNVAEVADVAGGQGEISRAPPAVVPLHDPSPPPGRMVRLDWSGEWVSRDRWETMSDLERHGSQGRLFCGKCWQYRDREIALGCLDGQPCNNP